MGGHEKARECGRCQDKWLTLSAEKERAMAYWWVNHKQTFKSEIEGGYIWSPQRKANGGEKQTKQKIRPGEKEDGRGHGLKSVQVKNPIPSFSFKKKKKNEKFDRRSVHLI